MQRTEDSPAEMRNYSDDLRHFVEREPRRARQHPGRVAVADVAQKIRSYAGAGKERLVDAVVVEARHRPAVEPVQARGEDEIGALQRAVAKGGLLDLVRLAGKPARASVWGKSLGRCS